MRRDTIDRLLLRAYRDLRRATESAGNNVPYHVQRELHVVRFMENRLDEHLSLARSRAAEKARRTRRAARS